jgi:hypothetical protein
MFVIVSEACRVLQPRLTEGRDRASCDVFVTASWENDREAFSDRYEPAIIFFSSPAAQRGLWHPLSRGFLITHNDAPQSVGPLWTSDQPVAETSTWPHTTDKYPCPRWDSNPWSQQASGRRPTP